MFGRRRKARDGRPTPSPDGGTAPGEGASGSETEADGQGPWDSEEIEVVADDGRLDLGSVRVPIPPGGQIQVELDNSGAPRAVHLVTVAGRLTIAAFAAPRSPGLWREIAGELAENLRSEGARVTVLDGPFGREVLGTNQDNAMRFMGVDGPRWMVRCVAAGPEPSTDALADIARDVLAGTVVVRSEEALPVRTTLPVVLPAVLLQQLAAVQAQAAAKAAASARPPTTAPPARTETPGAASAGNDAD